MNLNQLNCFLKVAENLSFTKAAEQLYISQTAVTNHIKNLENEIGFLLFERNKKRVELTKEGVQFLSEVYKLKNSMDSILKVVDQIQKGETNSIRLGYIKGIENDILIHLLGDLYQKEEVEFQLLMGNQLSLKKLLERNEVDGIFSYNPDFSDDYHSILLKSYPFYLAVSEKDSLSSKECISYRECINKTNVSFDSTINQENPDLIQTLLHVAIHSCSAIVPSFAIHYTDYTKYIKFIPIVDCLQTFDIYFIYNKYQKNSLFIHFLKQIENFKEKSN